MSKYLNDPREMSIDSKLGVTYENDNRIESMYHWCGKVLDLCNMPVDEYMKSIYSQGTGGNQGVQGPKGNDGEMGYQGFQGVFGTPGVQGDRGFQGYDGQIGPQGNQGYQGKVGSQGNKGAQGPQGYQGADMDISGVSSMTLTLGNKIIDNEIIVSSALADINERMITGATIDSSTTYTFVEDNIIHIPGSQGYQS